MHLIPGFSRLSRCYRKTSIISKINDQFLLISDSFYPSFTQPASMVWITNDDKVLTITTQRVWF